MTNIDLTTPLTLNCGAVLQNRIVKAAMSEQLAGAQNEPTADLIRLYGLWSQSGAAALITGNVMIDRQAISEPGQVVLQNDGHLPLMRAWAAAAGGGGAQVWMQINHGGRQIPRMLARRSLAPSAVGLGLLFSVPEELTVQQISSIVEQYATTARLATGAGFTGVQIHAAHGYLLSQFLSPRTNQRRDAYGGTAERRCRIVMEVIQAVRQAIGQRRPLTLKINSADYLKGGLSAEEAIEHVRVLARGPIDVLEISGGTFESAAMLGAPADVDDRASSRREAYFLNFARRARAYIDRPLMLTGGFRTVEVMQDALRTGVVDLIGLARPLIEKPHLPAALLARRSGTEQSADKLRLERVTRTGLLGGLTELAWHTTQMWRLAAGSGTRIRLERKRALLEYLSRQAVQWAKRK